MKNITTLLIKRESHENIFLVIIYLEKISFFPLNILMKVVRKIIHPSVRIGKNARIFHSVTIGNREGGRREGTPKIGDNTTVSGLVK